jgi:alanine transaminase
VTFCNIGNPQEFRQKPITFFREVLSCVVNPDLLENTGVNEDARKRAKRILDEIISSGSYTHSLGIQSVRENIARFIEKKDKVPRPGVEDLVLTEGASQGVHLLLSAMITKRTDSIMIPIPQYPLYTAAISLYGGTVAPYYMDEDSGWQLDMKDLERSYQEEKKNGRDVKAIVVINPGNPTGSILSKETIKNVIEFAVKNRLVVIAD